MSDEQEFTPEFRFLPSAVVVHLSMKRGKWSRDNDHVTIHVYRDGLVEVHVPGGDPHGPFERRRELNDLLTEWEVCSWQRIGPEDSELFLTPEWAALLAPQLAQLGGWTTVPIPESETVT